MLLFSSIRKWETAKQRSGKSSSDHSFSRTALAQAMTTKMRSCLENRNHTREGIQQLLEAQHANHKTPGQHRSTEQEIVAIARAGKPKRIY